jgi:hypothetical protein
MVCSPVLETGSSSRILEAGGAPAHHGQAAGAGTRRGGAPGRPSTMSEQLLAGKSMLETWGVEGRAFRTRRVGSLTVDHGDFLKQYW